MPELEPIGVANHAPDRARLDDKPEEAAPIENMEETLALLEAGYLEHKEAAALSTRHWLSITGYLANQLETGAISITTFYPPPAGATAPDLTAPLLLGGSWEDESPDWELSQIVAAKRDKLRAVGHPVLFASDQDLDNWGYLDEQLPEYISEEDVSVEIMWRGYKSRGMMNFGGGLKAVEMGRFEMHKRKRWGLESCLETVEDGVARLSCGDGLDECNLGWM